MSIWDKLFSGDHQGSGRETHTVEEAEQMYKREREKMQELQDRQDQQQRQQGRHPTTPKD
jgi:hypothetical protein